MGVLEVLKTGKSTLLGPVVDALVGDLVGALVGDLVGRGSRSPALCVAHNWLLNCLPCLSPTREGFFSLQNCPSGEALARQSSGKDSLIFCPAALTCLCWPSGWEIGETRPHNGINGPQFYFLTFSDLFSHYSAILPPISRSEARIHFFGRFPTGLQGKLS